MDKLTGKYFKFYVVLKVFGTHKKKIIITKRRKLTIFPSSTWHKVDLILFLILTF